MMNWKNYIYKVPQDHIKLHPFLSQLKTVILVFTPCVLK